jgi:hypothetical protein
MNHFLDKSEIGIDRPEMMRLQIVDRLAGASIVDRILQVIPEKERHGIDLDLQEKRVEERAGDHGADHQFIKFVHRSTHPSENVDER